MRLVVSGYYGSGNVGDEAVLAGMLTTLRSLETDLSVTVISANPSETQQLHGVRAVGRTAIPAITAALASSDGLISGGGSLLQDRTSPRPVAYYAGLMQLARLLRRPYAIYAQGLGPLERGYNRRLAASVLERARYVSMRDDASVRLARELGVRRPVDVVPDPALALAPSRRTSNGHVIVAVRDWQGLTGHIEPLRAALRSLSADHRIVSMPMRAFADVEASAEVVRGVPNAEVMGPSVALHQALDAIASASLVIGMRLHALILAAACGVPALAISYDPKVDSFAGQAGQPMIGSVHVPPGAPDIVAAARALLAADRQPYLDRIEQLRSGLERSAIATLEVMRGDI